MSHVSLRHRVLPLAWTASLLSAAILVLGVNGTLSSWTSAAITNNTNSLNTGGGVILRETGPDGTLAHALQTCYSSSGVGNTSVCSSVNKFGGTAVSLLPGVSQVTDVTFSNVGGVNASSFQLGAGACTQTPAAGSGTPAATDLCGTLGELTTSVSCSGGPAYSAGAAWTDLVSSAVKPSALGTLTHTGTLAAAAVWTCRFTVALNPLASVLDQGITVTQPLTWTLSA